MLDTLQRAGNSQLTTTEKLKVAKQCHSKNGIWITKANFTEENWKSMALSFKEGEASFMSHTCIIKSQVL